MSWALRRLDCCVPRQAAAVRFAQFELERGESDAAAALLQEIRRLAGTDHDFLRHDARLALAQDDRRRAGEILEQLRRLAGEAWNADDEALLDQTRG